MVLGKRGRSSDAVNTVGEEGSLWAGVFFLLAYTGSLEALKLITVYRNRLAYSCRALGSEAAWVSIPELAIC